MEWRQRSIGVTTDANFGFEVVAAMPIRRNLHPILATDTVLCTDGSCALAAAARHLDIEHHSINLSAGIRVRGARHVQNVHMNWFSYFPTLAG
jgi:hypothetical protein